MDDKRFDELVKQIGAGSEARRSFLKRAVGGALAGLLALGGSEASARKRAKSARRRAKGAVVECREEGHPCEGNQECCPGLECRVTGPGNALRCAKPPKKSPPKKSPPKKSPPKKSPPKY